MVNGTLCGLTLDGKYRLEEYLGESDRTAVFATKLADGQPAIARLIEAGSPAAPRLVRSWLLATGLNHPNLVRVYDAGDAELDGVLGSYAVTEHPEDRLSEIIAARALSTDEAREVLLAVVPCLEYLHRNGVAHGAIEAANVVAIGNAVKILADTLEANGAKPGDPSGGPKSRDIAGIGSLVVEMLLGKRPAHRAEAEQLIANADLQAPFHDIALGCIRDERYGRWSLQQVAAALSPAPVAEAPTPAVDVAPERPLRVRNGMIAAAGGVLLLLVFAAYRMFFGHTTPVPESVAHPPAQEAPAVFPPPPAKAHTSGRPSAMPLAHAPGASRPTAMPTSRTAQPSDWAVVAAIYRTYDAAEHRAKSLSGKWRQGELKVYPAEGTGTQYMVLVASGLTKDQAERVQRQAKSAGLPGDTYVTRLR